MQGPGHEGAARNACDGDKLWTSPETLALALIGSTNEGTRKNGLVDTIMSTDTVTSAANSDTNSASLFRHHGTL